MARQRTPDGPPPPPPVQKLRIRYAKRGRLRFSSTRDFSRALERALRRADVPMAVSAGFHPHPLISYANAAPTGTASEAEHHQRPDARKPRVQAVVGLLRACERKVVFRARLTGAAPAGRCRRAERAGTWPAG